MIVYYYVYFEADAEIVDCCCMRIGVYVDESTSFQTAVVAFSHDTIHLINGDAK